MEKNFKNPIFLGNFLVEIQIQKQTQAIFTSQISGHSNS